MNEWFAPILDISHWQGDMDAQKAIAAGAKGVYVKAGGVNKDYGSNYTDEQWDENAGKFPSLIPTGYYWYFHPHWSGTKQAIYFADLLKRCEWKLPPAVDVENNITGVSKAVFQKELKSFLDTLGELLFLANQVIYTRGLFWNENVGNPAWASERLLWIARYSTTLNHPWEDDDKYRPAPWENFWLWQWSSDGNRQGHRFGAKDSHDIDLNYCTMTEEEFLAFAQWEHRQKQTKGFSYSIKEVEGGIDISIRGD